MIKQLIIIMMIVIQYGVVANELSIDSFNGLQNRMIINLETQIDVQESVNLGVISLNESRKGINYNTVLFDASYRRYALESTGIFYSFGIRAGSITLDDESNVEDDICMMPFYDIGIKSKLSKHWSNTLRIEASYVIIYTDEINADHLIGLQVTPFFSFGYNFN